jgi:hypothetical protein
MTISGAVWPPYATQPPVESLPKFTDLLDVLALPEVPERVVWHHTDAGGALGIVKNRQVWATWARLLNDSTEVQHGISHIRDAWDRMSKVREYAYADKIEGLLREREDRRDELLSRCFVCCATIVPDSLSAYRGYGTYSVGINVDTFAPSFQMAREQITAEVPDAVGWRVVAYTSAEKDVRARNLFDAWTSLLSSWPAEHGLDTAAAKWADVLYELTVVHMKHESFADEREARYYAWSEPHDGHREQRVSSNTVVPYLPLRLDVVDGITEIHIGPGLMDGEAAAEAMRDYLRTRLGSSAVVVHANLPYR